MEVAHPILLRFPLSIERAEDTIRIHNNAGRL